MRSVMIGARTNVMSFPSAHQSPEDYEQMASSVSDAKQELVWRRWNSGLRSMTTVEPEHMLDDLSALLKPICEFTLGKKDPRCLRVNETRDLKLLTERFNFISDPFRGFFKPPVGLTFREFFDELVCLQSAVQATPSPSNFGKTALKVFFQHLVPARTILSKCGMQVVIDTVALVECIGLPTHEEACQLNQALPDSIKNVSAPPATSSEAGVYAVAPKRKPGKAEGNKAEPQSHAPIEYPKWASQVASRKKTRDQCHQEYETENVGRNPYGRSSFIKKLSAWMRDNPMVESKGQAP